MNERLRMVGYNRTVKLSWLEYTARLAMDGRNEEDIEKALQELLKDQLSVGSHAKRGSREKTITILLKTWVRVPEELRALRDEGLQLLRQEPRAQHLAIHWGMTMAAYPFWRIVAETAGRLVRLQGSVTAAQVQRRVRERLGERETVSRSARYVLRAFVEWGALAETGEKGAYRLRTAHKIANPRLLTWLIESLLHSTEEHVKDFAALLEAPALFPFQLLRLRPDQLSHHSRLEIVRQGIDRDAVMLRVPRGLPPALRPEQETRGAPLAQALT